MSAATCAEVTEHLEELALGSLAEPGRSRLLAHVAACAECRGQLDAMSALADSLLVLAPQHEPPPGFESRVLDRWSVTPSRRVPWRLLATAAAIIMVVAVGAFALGRRQHADTSGSATTATGVIVRHDGSRLGAISLIRGDHPYALVTIDHPQPGGAYVDCRLVLADGTRVTVGSWNYTDVASGVWAVGLKPELLDAVAMEVVDESGNVLATATLV